jgi:hypothetical protein
MDQLSGSATTHGNDLDRRFIDGFDFHVVVMDDANARTSPTSVSSTSSASGE